MSTIYVQFSNIAGEAKSVEFSGQIECSAMRHVIYLPVIRAASRVQSDSKHGPIALTHAVDKASPLLKKAAMMGANQGEVKIRRTRTVAGRSTAVETITLTNVVVVRVDVDTPVSSNTLEPSEEPMETFYLDYDRIQWSAKRIFGDRDAGVIEGAWQLPS